MRNFMVSVSTIFLWLKIMLTWIIFCLVTLYNIAEMVAEEILLGVVAFYRPGWDGHKYYGVREKRVNNSYQASPRTFNLKTDNTLHMDSYSDYRSPSPGETHKEEETPNLISTLLAGVNLPENFNYEEGLCPVFETAWSSGDAIDAMLLALACMTDDELTERIYGKRKEVTSPEVANRDGDMDGVERVAVREEDVKFEVAVLGVNMDAHDTVVVPGEDGYVIASGMRITSSDEMVRELLAPKAADELKWSKHRKMVYSVYNALSQFFNFVA